MSEFDMYPFAPRMVEIDADELTELRREIHRYKCALEWCLENRAYKDLGGICIHTDNYCSELVEVPVEFVDIIKGK